MVAERAEMLLLSERGNVGNVGNWDWVRLGLADVARRATLFVN
jgi:hypothetical protein